MVAPASHTLISLSHVTYSSSLQPSCHPPSPHRFHSSSFSLPFFCVYVPECWVTLWGWGRERAERRSLCLCSISQPLIEPQLLIKMSESVDFWGPEALQSYLFPLLLRASRSLSLSPSLCLPLSQSIFYLRGYFSHNWNPINTYFHILPPPPVFFCLFDTDGWYYWTISHIRTCPACRGAQWCQCYLQVSASWYSQWRWSYLSEYWGFNSQ